MDAEVKKILETAFSKAKEILSKNKDKLLAISEVLITREKLSGTEFEELYEKGTLTETEKQKDKSVTPQTAAEKPKPKEGPAPKKERPAKGRFDEGYDPN